MAEQKKQDTNQLLKVRREKLADLQANGKDPFQITKFDTLKHHTAGDRNVDRARIHDFSSLFIVLFEDFSCLCFIKTFYIWSLVVF